MKSLLIATGLAVPLVFAATPSQAAPRVNPRGAALLDREIARLKKLKSFSVAGTETVRSPQVTRTTKIQASLQVPFRLLVRADVVSPGADPTGSKVRFLIGPSQVFTSIGGTSARALNIGSQSDRSQGLVAAVGSLPSVAFSFFTLASGINPVRDKSTVAVRVVPLRMGKITLQNVVIQQKGSRPGEPLETYEYGFDKEGLRRIAARRVVSGGAITVRGEFEAVKPNWKGSQAATDAAIYNWNTAAPGIPIRKVAAPQTSIAPQAQTIFARAAKLYAGQKTLNLKWSHKDEDSGEKEDQELRMDQEGRLFLKGNFALFTVAAIDGKSSIEYDDLLKTYTQESLSPSQAREKTDSQLAFATVVDQALSFFVGEDPLTSGTGLKAQGYETLRATVLPAQPLGGEPCDIVRLSVGQRDKDDAFSTEQQTFWFARSDGRLVRWQSQKIEDGYASEKTDNQMKVQEFNPKLEAKDFQFEIPKGAKKGE